MRVRCIGLALTMSLLFPVPLAAASDVHVGPEDNGFLVEFNDDLTPDVSEPVAEPPASDSPATPVVDVGTDEREAFCSGTNWTWSCDEEPVEEPEAPVLTLAMITSAFQRVPLPADRIVIQPPGGRTLVNFETNFYTDSEPLTRVVTLLGRRITLRATPASWTWTFGDGTTTTTSTPGAAYPDLDITHTYEREGQVAASVATTYTATFSVDGGPQQAVPGTVTIDGPPATLQVDPARPQLVDYR